MEMKETTRDPPGVHNLAFRNDNEHVDVINLKGLRDNSQRIKNSQNKKTVHTNQDERFNIEDYLHKTKNYSVHDKQPHFKGLLEKKYNEACEYCKEHKSRMQYGIYGILITAYLAGVIATCSLNFQRALPLFIVTVLAIFFICWDFLTTKYEERIALLFSPAETYFKKHWFWLKWALCVAFLITFIFWIIFDIAERGYQHLISFGGLLMYVFLLFIFSKYPNRIVWRPVFSGIAMQFLLGILVMRTSVGFDMFNWLGIQIQTFLEYADAGAKFVFGEKYRDHFFAFKVLPVLVFFSTVMSMLYHIGFMQWLVAKVGWTMQILMGTAPVESLVAAGNIFVGQTESPLMVRPYLPYITISEIHAIMTAGFSTIAGTVFGAYVSFGISPSHLLTASVMSAPASLATSKLFWPETEKPILTQRNDLQMIKSETKSMLEAALLGASSSIKLVANVLVNLISFLSLLAFMDSALSWVGDLFNYPQLNFEKICAYIFMPFSFMMGVDWEDCFIVAGLLGYKTFFNEFVAYERLSKLIHNREKGGKMYINGVKQYMTVRSEVIATYALCGFANFGSLGIVTGGLTSIAPSKQKEIAASGFRALIAGTVACFMTACVAGMLVIPDLEVPCHIFLGNAFNSTDFPANSTKLVECCQQLFTSINGSQEIFHGGNYTLSSWKGCCRILDQPALNCTSI
ncbi:solute carrier family 28 member 3 isoform X2 [Columba livia]|uniref:solute carrier family 28 member 3 isoform X2 n=1 Tax=Columba livia TaxID=8932 RepID=UPI0031BB4D4B